MTVAFFGGNMVWYNKENEGLESFQNDALNIFGKYDLDKSLIWMTEEYGKMIQAIRKKSKEDIIEEIGDLYVRNYKNAKCCKRIQGS